jgi:hypothetical protein
VVKTIRIGGGAGYSGDRIEPALELAEKGRLDYLVFECLAERTIAIAQQARAGDPNAGYDPLLVDRMEAVLPACRHHGTRIVTNMGGANPAAAASVVRRVAAGLGLRGLKVAAIVGDDVLDEMRRGAFVLAETGLPVRALGDALVSANAYIGAEPIVLALAAGADVVLTGRAADPSLFVAPLVREFGWAVDDWPMLGRGTLVGHLLECAGQITGGYFADPGIKDVPSLDRLGFPLAEVAADGSAVITKVAGSGGAITLATCKEQLLYEVHDPARYVTPDVVADFSGVSLLADAPDRVRVDGANGRARPGLLKVAVGYRDGYIGEGQISYAGAGAAARASLARSIVTARLDAIGVQASELQCDLLGCDAIHGRATPPRESEPYEVRLRVAGRCRTRRDAERIAREVEALYTNGPAGGGGAMKTVREVLAIGSTFIDREHARCDVLLEEA